jgi:hypothetical protein
MAYKLWGYLKKWCGRELPPGIFHPTILCDYCSFIPAGTQTLFKTILDRELKKYFPEIHEKVQALCYIDEPMAYPGK